MNLQELIKNVIQWSTDRKIIPNSNTQAQLVKSDEELKELLDGYYANDKDLFMDGVGDYVVTIINAIATKPDGFMISKERIFEVKGTAYINDFNYDVRQSFSNLFRAQFDIDNSERYSYKRLEHLFSTIKLSLSNIIGVFNERNETTISIGDCYQMAWDSIKDRKGYLSEEGIFIKEE